MNRKKDTAKTGLRIKFLTPLFYIAIWTVASLALFLLFYWLLRLDSSITSLIQNTAKEPLYFWPYIILTLATIILFGINSSLLIYKWRKFGFPQLKIQSGAGAGVLVGTFASACPVCGSALLSAIGITGGLAVFPLQGLELKALSFGLMSLPVWLTIKDIKNSGCIGDVCTVPRDASFKRRDTPWLIGSITVTMVLAFATWNLIRFDPIIASVLANSLRPVGITTSSSYDQIAAKVRPEEGYQSKIVLGNSIVKLIAYGAIDPEKFYSIYEDREDLPNDLNNVLKIASYEPIHLTRENANVYLNLLWPLGLTNQMFANNFSPVNTRSLFNFASTSGWRLGREENAGANFNKFGIIYLTGEQEKLVTKVAQNIYRPCCNNSTFYQDCNHGSAMLGLLELGVSQGLTEEELYREALAFNSFWFPQTYTQIALYFRTTKNTDWAKVDPKIILGKDFSSIGGWRKNIQAEFAKAPGFIPEQKENATCNVKWFNSNQNI